MSTITVSNEHMPPASKVIQPAWVRAMHWAQRGGDRNDDHVGMADLQRLAAVQIHLLARSVTLGGWLGGALLWHFAAMWLLMVERPASI